MSVSISKRNLMFPFFLGPGGQCFGLNIISIIFNNRMLLGLLKSSKGLYEFYISAQNITELAVSLVTLKFIFEL